MWIHTFDSEVGGKRTRGQSIIRGKDQGQFVIRGTNQGRLVIRGTNQGRFCHSALQNSKHSAEIKEG